MVIVFEKDLVLKKDSVFEESVEVKGSIRGKDDLLFDLVVKGNITADDITARYITAGNITAGNISAWDINALDINYYAVCFAYQNIKCESIKGSRENAKHFVLDGKITTKQEVKKK